MTPNLSPSQRNAILGVIDPDANTAGGSPYETVFASAAQFGNLMAIIQSGTLGASATLDAKLEQAKDDTGTDVKDIDGKAITQFIKANNDDNQAIINCRSDELDVNNDFTHVRLSLTVGTATSDISAVLLGLDARYAPADADDKDLASVVEIVT